MKILEFIKKFPDEQSYNNWLPNDLETFKKRQKYLEARMAQDGLVLTDAQLNALEKAHGEKKAQGEIETHYPSYLGAQDTYYVGTIKDVGRTYQQIFIDTYYKVAHVLKSMIERIH